MENPEVNTGRFSNLARRWKKRSAEERAGYEAQGTFFQPTPLPALKPSPVVQPPSHAELTADQAAALQSIEAAYEPGSYYLLTGHAGSGKTYMMQRLTKNMLANKRRVILSAPTHKAVAVLARKLTEAKIRASPAARSRACSA